MLYNVKVRDDYDYANIRYNKSINIMVRLL